MISSISAKQTEMKKELDQFKAEHDAFVQEHDEVIAEHKETITRLHGDVRVLESGIGNVRPPISYLSYPI